MILLIRLNLDISTVWKKLKYNMMEKRYDFKYEKALY